MPMEEGRHVLRTGGTRLTPLELCRTVEGHCSGIPASTVAVTSWIGVGAKPIRDFIQLQGQVHLRLDCARLIASRPM
jgi:hypothetical protein